MPALPPVPDARSKLLALASRLIGQPPERLVDEDGDVILRDSPFGIFARLRTRSTDGARVVVFVAGPLLELPATEAAGRLLEQTLGTYPVDWKFGEDVVHLFTACPEAVLDDEDAFRMQVASMAAYGDLVVAAVQPVLGGLTAEQYRVLEGWRGEAERLDGLMMAIVATTHAKVTAEDPELRARDAWSPLRESLPLLITEEEVLGGWVKRFATVDAKGSVRLRGTVAGRREGERTYQLTFTRLDAEAAWTWARRLGATGHPGPMGAGDLQALAGHGWHDLLEAASDLPGERSQRCWPAEAP
jgi:hypothetical protein